MTEKSEKKNPTVSFAVVCFGEIVTFQYILVFSVHFQVQLGKNIQKPKCNDGHLTTHQKRIVYLKLSIFSHNCI